MPKKILEGKVISHQANKTVVVKVFIRRKEKKYQKFVNMTNKYIAHDEHNKYTTGDSVKIIESKPYSKLKTWAVIDQNEARK